MGYNMKRGAAPKFKDLGSSPAKEKVDLTKKKVGPVAEKKEQKKETYKVPTDFHEEYRKGKKEKGFDTRIINPGYEEPIKIQALHREGLTPGSQKFMKRKK